MARRAMTKSDRRQAERKMTRRPSVDLHEWTNLFSRHTGLPVTIWISVRGLVATDPYASTVLAHREAVTAWIELNRDILRAYWRGDIDGAEMAQRSKLVP